MHIYTFSLSLFHETEHRPIKTSRFRGEEFLCRRRLVAPGYTVFSIQGSCTKVHTRCHTQRVGEWWGDHGARQYRTQRRGKIKSTLALLEGRAKATELRAEENREKSNIYKKRETAKERKRRANGATERKIYERKIDGRARRESAQG